MREINKVMIVGRVVHDIELEKLKLIDNTELSTVSFTIANNKGEVNGESKGSNYIKCKAYKQMAENIAKVCQKGTLLTVVGKLVTDNYVNKEGKKVYTWNVYVEEFNVHANRKVNEPSKEEPVNNLNKTDVNGVPVETTVNTEPVVEEIEFDDFDEF